MKRLFSFFALALISLAALADNVYFGYSPLNVSSENLSAVGSGKSNIVDAAICLDPNADPAVSRLKGQQIKGVRVFIRQEYATSQQASNRYVFYSTGLNDTPVKTTCKFYEGWNEVEFTTPVTIGDVPLYIGARVYETFGTPYPFCTFVGASADQGFFVRAGKDSEWITSSSNSVLLIQAILEDSPSLTASDGVLSGTAHVSFSDAPLTVRPDGLMSGKLYVHNQSAEALENLTFETADDHGVKHEYTLNFGDAPLAAFDGRIVPYQVYAPSQQGTSQPLTYNVKAITPVGGTKQNAEGRSVSFTGHYYVMQDAFVRVPLVEEFTSQYCVNCPFMAYYLDLAIEDWRESGKPLVYVAHHSGFAKDLFTQAVDDELTYLFGLSGETYNPAVMYDRRVFPGNSAPVISATKAEQSIYDEAILAVSQVAALAEININKSEDGQKVVVSGSVNRDFVNEGIPCYLTCYLIENGIEPTGKYFQKGLNGEYEDAPADLDERYRHNGVIRHVFTTRATGDELTIQRDGDVCTFEVSYDYPTTFSPLPIMDESKTDIVAFIHLYDSKMMSSNYVLNAGSLSLTQQAMGVSGVKMQTTNSECYDLQGRRVISPARGLYIKGGKLIKIKN